VRLARKLFTEGTRETVWKIRISSLPDSRECSKRAKKGQFAALGVIKYTRSRAFYRVSRQSLEKEF
jgi:hypothetical protein